MRMGSDTMCAETHPMMPHSHTVNIGSRSGSAGNRRHLNSMHVLQRIQNQCNDTRKSILLSTFHGYLFLTLDAIIALVLPDDSAVDRCGCPSRIHTPAPAIPQLFLSCKRERDIADV